MYDPNGQTLIRLGFNNQTGTNLASGTMYDGACNAVVSVSGGGNGNGTAGGNGTVGGNPSPSVTGSAPGPTTSTGAGVVRTVEVTGLIGVVVAMGFAVL
jgi:cholinesterase